MDPLGPTAQLREKTLGRGKSVQVPSPRTQALTAMPPQLP